MQTENQQENTGLNQNIRLDKINKFTKSISSQNCRINILFIKKKNLRIDYILGHKRSLSKFKKIEIKPFLLPPQW